MNNNISDKSNGLSPVYKIIITILSVIFIFFLVTLIVTLSDDLKPYHSSTSGYTYSIMDGQYFRLYEITQQNERDGLHKRGAYEQETALGEYYISSFYYYPSKAAESYMASGFYDRMEKAKETIYDYQDDVIKIDNILTVNP